MNHRGIEKGTRSYVVDSGQRVYVQAYNDAWETWFVSPVRHSQNHSNPHLGPVEGLTDDADSLIHM